MGRGVTDRIGALAVGLALVLSPAMGEASWELVEGERGQLELGANLQLVSAYVDMGGLEGIDELPGLDDQAGLGGAVGRLEWYGKLGSRADLSVHQRLFWQTSTLPEELLGQGLGVSAGSERRVDTQLDLLEGDDLRLSHDLDRAVLGLYFDRADLYLGRQAIRWGTSDLFAVADRFAPLSPFELDTIQRRGVDAARAVTHLSPSWELDLVVADRGSGEPVALGAKAEYFGVRSDVYGGVGRFWERLSAMGGVSVMADYWKFYGEAEALWNLDDDGMDRPRATVGAQRMAMRWQMGLEYHYNGLGVGGGDGYGQALASEELSRGESYLLGRHYLGATGMYLSEGSLSAGGGAMVNIVDPSAVIFPSVIYELEEQFSIQGGAYVGVGERGAVDVGAMEGGDPASAVVMPSEFGASSDLYFVQMTAYF